MSDFPLRWQYQARPCLATRRADFLVYAQVKAFLDALADLSEKTNIYPNINFSRNHVLLTLYPQAATFSAEEIAFASRAEHLLIAAQTQ
jgi:pterin-4a-carbinolamine dehydratase